MLQPYAVSIVDSFGYMTKQDFRKYFKVLDNILSPEVSIGFHSHNNMNLAFLTAQDVFEYNTQRNIIIGLLFIWNGARCRKSEYRIDIKLL